MGKIAFLFAGQGAQAPGMGKSLYESSPAAKKVLDLAEKLRPGTLSMCFEGDAAELSRTIHTQPCLFAVDLACAEALCEAGIQAQGAAGFSLGEMPAAAFCGVLPAEEAFRAVCERARLMDKAAQESPGAMTAVLKLEAPQVEALCAQFPGQAYPVNYNCPGQTVVAVTQDTAEAFEACVKEAGGRAMRLKVSGAFHSPWMQKAASDFYAYLSTSLFSAPSIPLYANRTAQPYGDAPQLLSQQMDHPVLWEQTIRAMQKDGYDRFVEVGPGKVLSGLVGKIGGAAVITNVQEWQDVPAAARALKEGAL